MQSDHSILPSCHLLLYHSFKWVQGLTCIIKPFLQQWLEFAHVLKAQVQGLKARDGRLAEVISIELPHGQANIPLVRRRETEMERHEKCKHNQLYLQQRLACKTTSCCHMH